MRDLADEVVIALTNRYTRAVVLADDDQDLWNMFAKAADLHRPLPRADGPDLRCRECCRGSQNRIWPCQTLGLMASGLEIAMPPSSRAAGRWLGPVVPREGQQA
jgi:hypothetical protein